MSPKEKYYYCTRCVPFMINDELYPKASITSTCISCGRDMLLTCEQTLGRAHVFNAKARELLDRTKRKGRIKMVRTASIRFGEWERGRTRFQWYALVGDQSVGWEIVESVKMEENGPNYQLTLYGIGGSLGHMDFAVALAGDIFQTFGSPPMRLEVRIINDKMAVAELICGHSFEEFWVIPDGAEIPCIFRRWGINRDMILDEALWRGMQTEHTDGDFRVVI